MLVTSRGTGAITEILEKGGRGPENFILPGMKRPLKCFKMAKTRSL